MKSKLIAIKVSMVVLVSGCTGLGMGRIDPHKYVDPINAVTGEQYIPPGIVPPPKKVSSPVSYRHLSIEMLWNEIDKTSHGFVIVGIKESHIERGYFRGTVFLPPERANLVRGKLHAAHPGLRPPGDLQPAEIEMPVMADGKPYPAFVARLDGPETLLALRQDSNVDFVEPLYFLDSLGCSKNDYLATHRGDTDDGRLSVPSEFGSDLIPYTYHHLAVEDAWKREDLPGKNIRIGVVDTGASVNQEQLNQRFPIFDRRPAAEHLKEVLTIDDNCGHGTKIAGIAAAPADGRNIVGIAWGSPLTTVKIADGPVHFQGSRLAICHGIQDAISHGARVISMAFGVAFTSDFLERCIADIFDSPPEVILIAAAGTNFPFVTFPATMNREVVAASLVEISPTGEGYKMLPWHQVGYGPDVDFVIPISTNDVASPGLRSGDQIWSLGGSSAATAHLVGLFALAWSKNPTLSRAQLITKVRESSSLVGITDQWGLPPYADIGAGIPNAYIATGGSTSVAIVAPSRVLSGASFTLSAKANGSDDLQYTWLPVSGTKTGATIEEVGGAPGTIQSYLVGVLDPIDGRRNLATHSVEVRASVEPPRYRRLLSQEVVVEFPVFFDGNRVDRIINAGKSVPNGCTIKSVRGVALCADYSSACSLVQPSWNEAGYGFSVSRAAALGPQSLQTNVHVWHDGVNGIRAAVVYDVEEESSASCDVLGATQPSPF